MNDYEINHNIIFSYNEKENFFEKKPNILFIMLDDLGKEWISCFGSSQIRTPAIDKLISNRFSFKNVYSMLGADLLGLDY